MIPAFTPLDILALGCFLAGWIGYTAVADHSRWSARSITAEMARYRERWMMQMLGRDLRIIDTSIVGNLLTGVSFFASTSILVVGGLVALLGAKEQAMATLAELPFAMPPEGRVWQLKVLLLIAIFVYAFFKFAWAFRLSNYCSILIGAAPLQGSLAQRPEARPEAETHARRAARMVALVAFHVNHGLRAYFFALAALAWFIHPLALIATTVGVIGVLYRREFRSRALRTLRDGA